MTIVLQNGFAVLSVASLTAGILSWVFMNKGLAAAFAFCGLTWIGVTYAIGMLGGQ